MKGVAAFVCNGRSKIPNQVFNIYIFYNFPCGKTFLFQTARALLLQIMQFFFLNINFVRVNLLFFEIFVSLPSFSGHFLNVK